MTQRDATPQTERDLPKRVVVGANGAYWLDYGEHYSMCPVSEDNDPVVPVARYVRVDDLAPAIDAVADALNGWDQGEEPRPDTHRHWSKIVSRLLEGSDPASPEPNPYLDTAEARTERMRQLSHDGPLLVRPPEASPVAATEPRSEPLDAP